MAPARHGPDTGRHGIHTHNTHTYRVDEERERAVGRWPLCDGLLKVRLQFLEPGGHRVVSTILAVGPPQLLAHAREQLLHIGRARRGAEEADDDDAACIERFERFLHDLREQVGLAGAGAPVDDQRLALLAVRCGRVQILPRRLFDLAGRGGGLELVGADEREAQVLGGLLDHRVWRDGDLLCARAEAVHHGLAEVVEELAQVRGVRGNLGVDALPGRPVDGVVGDCLDVLGGHVQLLVQQRLRLGIHRAVLHVDEVLGLRVGGVAFQAGDGAAEHERLELLILFAHPQQPAAELLLRDGHEEALDVGARARVAQHVSAVHPQLERRLAQRGLERFELGPPVGEVLAALEHVHGPRAAVGAAVEPLVEALVFLAWGRGAHLPQPHGCACHCRRAACARAGMDRCVTSYQTQRCIDKQNTQRSDEAGLHTVRLGGAGLDADRLTLESSRKHSSSSALPAPSQAPRRRSNTCCGILAGNGRKPYFCALVDTTSVPCMQPPDPQPSRMSTKHKPPRQQHKPHPPRAHAARAAQAE